MGNTLKKQVVSNALYKRSQKEPLRMGCGGRSRQRSGPWTGKWIGFGGKEKLLTPFQARFGHAELTDRGGIVKESRKGTGLWDGYIGKEVVE